ncbi:MAG: aminotransferase class III-fold pyridoxal phosphate-dependent enzyme [Deltaproteobacteria bacterium]|nr:aminotransferase class III-fold pyridoxal phosphate-dependent enzyme [Deltaproteobacteria bacterium]
MHSNNVFYRGELKRVYPIMERGEGVYLYDSEGKKYLDAMSGIAVANIGYGIQEVADAITEQVKKLSFCFTVRFTSQEQEDLAKRIADLSPPGLKRVWFSLSGSEANECAIKAARQYHVETGNPSKFKVISRWQSYHGSSLATLSISGAENWRRNYAPMMAEYPKIAPVDCYRCPFGKNYPGCDLDCAHDLERVIKFSGANEISAFIAEPIVAGSTGATVPPPEYFKLIRSICDKYNILFIVDEVFCGNGRTGKFYAIEHWDVVPDIISVAKGIAGGYIPLGATVIHEKIHNAIYRGSGKFVHGVTFSGHPVACAAGIAVLTYMEKKGLVERAAEMGDYLMKKLSSLTDFPMVGQIRGKGLLLGIEFVADRITKEPFDPALGIARKIVQSAFQKGLIVQPGNGGADGVRGDHILICPPFTLSRAEADQIVEILREVFKDVQKSVQKPL